MKKYVKPVTSSSSATFEQRFIACVIARMLPNNVYQDGDDLCFDDGAFTASVCLNYNSAAASDCFYVTYKAVDPYILDLSSLYDDVLNNIVKINPYLFLSKYDSLASIDISIMSSITKNQYTRKINSNDLQFYRRVAYFATGDTDYLTYGGVTDCLLLNIMKLNKACEKLESSKGAPVIVHHKSCMLEGVPEDDPGQVVEEWDEKFETTDFVLNIKGFENHKFNVLLGESGSGKTTLLNIIAGIQNQYDGQLTFDGKDARELSIRRRNISYMPQNYVIYDRMTVFDNIALPLKVQGASSEEIKRRVFQIADEIGLTDCLLVKPRYLSGGQQQRVAIARAIIRRPDLIIFDEPLSNVDPLKRNDIRNIIRDLCKSYHITTIYSTHNIDEAVSLGDTFTIINGDKNISFDSSKDLLKGDNPLVKEIIENAKTI